MINDPLRKYECTYCDKKFKRSEHLNRHINIHLGVKPFKCQCGKQFGRNDELLRHKRTHRYSNIEMILQDSVAPHNRKLPIPNLCFSI